MVRHACRPRRLLSPRAPSGHQIRVGLGFTEGLMWRKNIEPFRFMASVHYTYTVPGSTGGINTYNGDIINTRFIIEYIADAKRGLGYALELLSVHGLDFRLDGHDLNLKPTSYSLLGAEPSAV